MVTDPFSTNLSQSDPQVTIGVTCFSVEVTRFFHKSDLQDDRSLAELCGSLLPLKKRKKYRTQPLQVPLTKVTRRGSVLYSKFFPQEKGPVKLRGNRSLFYKPVIK